MLDSLVRFLFTPELIYLSLQSIRVCSYAFISPPEWHEFTKCDGFSFIVINHKFRLLVFLRQLQQKFTASSAGYARAFTVRCFITKSNDAFNRCLTRLLVHVKGGRAFCTEVENSRGRFKTVPRKNSTVFSLNSCHNMIGIDEGRDIVRSCNLF